MKTLIVQKRFLDLEIGQEIQITNEEYHHCIVVNEDDFSIQFNWKEALSKGFLEEKIGETFLFPLNSWVRVKENPKSWASSSDGSGRNPVGFKESKHRKNRRKYPALGFVTRIEPRQAWFIPFSLRISNEDFGFSYSDASKENFEAIPTIKKITDLKVGDWVASHMFQTKSEKDYVVYQVVERLDYAMNIQCLDSIITIGLSELEKYGLIKVTEEEAENLLLLKKINAGDWVEIIPVIHSTWGKRYKEFAGDKVKTTDSFPPAEHTINGASALIIDRQVHTFTNFTRLSLRLLSKNEIKAIEAVPKKTKKQELIEHLVNECNFKVGNRFVSLDSTDVLIDSVDENRFEYDGCIHKLRYKHNGEYVDVVRNDSFIQRAYPNIQIGKYYSHFDNTGFSFGCKRFSLAKAEGLLELMINKGFSISFREVPEITITSERVLGIIELYKEWLKK
jgi:hypothetical protein